MTRRRAFTHTALPTSRPRPRRAGGAPCWPGRRVTLPLAAIALLGLTAGCSSRRPIEWNAQIAQWYSRGAIKPVAPPYRVWAEGDEKLFYQQLGFADATVVGRVRLVRLHSRREQPHHFALLFEPAEVLYGELEELVDSDKDLVLGLDRSSPEFRRALTAQTRLPGREFLLLLKRKPRPTDWPTVSGWRASLWRPPPEPPPRFVWSLYLPDAKLIEELRTLYQDLQQNGP